MFWKAYFSQSLGVRWLVGPQQETKNKGPWEALPSIGQPLVFLTPALEKSPTLQKMLERMIVAVRKDDSEVFCLSSDDPVYLEKTMESLREDQKVIVFGEPSWSFTESDVVPEKGQWAINNRAMLTHSLADLKAQPALKKESWLHLQKFVGLK